MPPALTSTLYGVRRDKRGRLKRGGGGGVLLLLLLLPSPFFSTSSSTFPSTFFSTPSSSITTTTMTGSGTPRQGLVANASHALVTSEIGVFFFPFVLTYGGPAANRTQSNNQYKPCFSAHQTSHLFSKGFNRRSHS